MCVYPKFAMNLGLLYHPVDDTDNNIKTREAFEDLGDEQRRTILGDAVRDICQMLDQNLHDRFNRQIEQEEGALTDTDSCLELICIRLQYVYRGAEISPHLDVSVLALQTTYSRLEPVNP